ncbi:DUF1998 domain-containing protein [Streptomyces liliifuscus]
MEAVVASMPDQSGGGEIRRRFLVVYDTLPCGTGYLHRLANPDTCRDVPVAARHRIDTYPCKEERKAACHRCLPRHVAGTEYAHVSCAAALGLLREVFGDMVEGWQVAPVAVTHDIPWDARRRANLKPDSLKASSPGLAVKTPRQASDTPRTRRAPSPPNSPHWAVTPRRQGADPRTNPAG